MMTYYHNPKCSKSRQGLEWLKAQEVSFEIKEYLKEKLSKPEILDVIKKLGEQKTSLLRSKEDIFKELSLKGQELSDSQMADLIIEHPKLLERPILVSKTKAAIGRPTENFASLI